MEIPRSGICRHGHGFTPRTFLPPLQRKVCGRRGQSFAVRRPGIIAVPAEVRDAFAKGARNWRRQPGVDVLEAALPCVALCGGVQLEQPVPTLARRAGVWIEEQVRFRSKAEQRGADDFFLRLLGLGAGVAFLVCFRFRENQFCYEERISQIRERVIKTLSRVNGAQCGEIAFGVFTYAHQDAVLLPRPSVPRRA